MKKTCKLLICILLLLPFSVVFGQVKSNVDVAFRTLRNDSDNLYALKCVGMHYLYKADFKNAVYYGCKLQRLGRESRHGAYYRLYSNIILGQAYTMTLRKGLAYQNLMQGKDMAVETKNDSALSSIYNGIGLFYANINRDYYSSLTYFFKGLDESKRCDYHKLYSTLLSNIATIYYLKDDTTGLRYALECYSYGYQKGDVFLMRNGAISAASLYYLKHDYLRAMSYIADAEKMERSNDLNDQVEIYTLYGCILSAVHRYEEASGYFKKAIGYGRDHQYSSDLKAYCEYAQMLMKLHRLDEAKKVLDEAKRLVDSGVSVVFKERLYEVFSQYYECIGQYSKALAFHKLYKGENDSVFNANKEYALNDMQTRYGMKKLEADLEVNRLEKARKIELMGTVIVCILIVTIGIYYLYRRKSALYRAIVKQNQHSIQREKLMEKQIAELKKPMIMLQTNKYTGSSLSSERGSELFERLEILMREERIYTDNMITREKVAERLGTNRTYLSQVINEQTGKTFTQYVNEYRTREAVEQLSDLQNDIPLKALSSELGFNSMTTFYSLFQSMVGMTPAQYRSSVQEVNRRS